MAGQSPSKSMEDRFWERVVPEPNSGCWLWDGNTKDNGYGTMYYHGIPTRTHRISWDLFRGPKMGLDVLHKCDVRICVNPDHLFLGTQIDNMRDAAKKGKFKK